MPVRFFVDFNQYCCIFRVFVFPFRPNAPLVFFFFCEIWQPNAPKKKMLGHAKVGSSGQENDGDANP